MTFEIDNKSLEVIIVRKKIKNIYIRVKDNKIYVNCNNFVSLSYIKKLLDREYKSILKMYNEQNIKKEEEQEVYFLGNKLNFILAEQVKIENNYCYGPSIKEINEYLEKNSLKFFEQRLNRLMNMFEGLPQFRLRTRKMKTRWGVCNKSSMTVTLNTLLIHKDVSLIDYVIVHELCHFKHMNHSPAFWREVSKYYPYYKEARKELRS